jgi:hypothetical protein
LKDEIYTKLKLGRRAGIQSRKERMQEESKKEKREEKREMNPSCAVCYCMPSLQKEMVQARVYISGQTLQVGLFVCMFVSACQVHAKTDLIKCYTSISYHSLCICDKKRIIQCPRIHHI